jgi:hypothetical protein
LAGTFGHSAILWNNCIITFGGMNAVGTGKNVSFNNNMVLVDTVTWHHYAVSSPAPPTGRFGHGCTLFGNIMVRLAGVAHDFDVSAIYDALFSVLFVLQTLS